MNKETSKQEHSLKAYINKDSKYLILGSFPSVKSRELNFYYGHKQNRFWKILSKVFNMEEPEDLEEKKEFLKKNKIALYDVIESCSIINSSDSSIRDVIPADIEGLIKGTEIETIAINGALAGKYFKKYNSGLLNKKRILFLPSTSPANATYSVERLLEEWIHLKEKT